MMENFWKTQDLNKNFPNAKNLAEVIEELNKWTQKRGRVICSVTVNGVRLSEQEELKFSQMPIREIAEIKTESQYPQVLLDESLLNCQEHLKKMINAYEKIAELFRLKDNHHAHKCHRYAIDSMQQFFEITNYAKILYEATRAPLPVQWDQLEKEVLKMLDQVLCAYEKKDYLLVADLLEYELTGLLTQWNVIISQICDYDGEQTPEAAIC